MKFRYLLFALFAVVGIAADNDIAAPKFVTGDRNNFQWRTTDDGSGHHSLHVVGAAAGGSVTVTGSQRTFTTVANTASGTIAAGCYGLTFVASSDFAGTIATNLPMAAGASYNVPLQKGDTTPSIAFTRSAGVLYTLELR